ncbi:isochorismate synthase, chloroplastic-like [Dorcoceras hygrometricum]|uniref:Isochorismate synthase, chloroplastic-like n=1 Tax=Dorcoceras hygrometricum TaxID=472368 RepID=A0A2Z7AR53_9LAMI|nr:isochorismate synthase, chloroplastic-like [Dorcoceras hygrometricum]
MASVSNHCVARFSDVDPKKLSLSSSPTTFARQSVHFSSHKYKELSSLSMNGCQIDDPRAPIGTIETKTFPMAPTPGLAADRLNSAIFDLRSNPSQLESGIIRLEVPIQQHIEALDWLRSQNNPLLPHTYFSGRESYVVPGFENGNNSSVAHQEKLVSVAGFGSAVSFRHLNSFSMNDWHSIKRFLSKTSPLIRAYGGMRFDARANISPEWKDFGSFYFMVPQVELDEFEGCSMIAATVAWDNRLSTTYEQAVAALEATMWQLSPVLKLNNDATPAVLLDQTHVPNQISWDLAVNEALNLIRSNDSALHKVVLARSSRVLANTEIDPLLWLEYLQAEAKNSYQFCLQPPEAPAFIGNTPERLFSRDGLLVSSDALAATRARESFDRGMYAGPVGWFGGAGSEFAVGIRSALVGKDTGAILYAGTGIVEGSKSAMEWKELELKTSQFTKLMKREDPVMATSGDH